MSEVRILIVQDEAIEALDLKQRLLHLGYPLPDIVHSGKEAISKARETRPDLILMGMMLSGEIDGIQAAERIRDFLDVPIIFLTAYADDKTLQRAKITEPYACIVKPFPEKELHIAIDMVLYKHAAERKLFTQRNKAVNEIRRAKEEWELTFDTVPDMIAIMDRQHRIVRVNKAMSDRIGRASGECIGLHCYEAVHRASCPPDFCPHTLTCRDGKEHTADVHEPNLGGYFLVSTTPILDDCGTVTGSIHVARDITERKKSEEALKLERLRLVSILDAMEDGVCIINRDYRIDYANPALESQYGRVSERKCYQYFVSREEPCATCYRGKVLGGEVVRKDVQSRRLDRIYEVTQIPLTNADGGISKLSIFHDVTERKRVERIKDEFIGMVSHELKTPLTVIIGALMVANSEGITPEKARELTQDATDSALSLAAMVDNLLELSRYQSNKLRLRFEPTSIDQVVTAVANRYRAKSEIHRLSLAIPPDLPVISCDPMRVERILSNLIENAIKYSPYGGDVRVFVNRQEDHIVIGVSDEGIGIAPENQGRLFLSFERINAYKENSIAGIGLGLKVCGILVEALNGRIWVESELDEGSIFYFTLPLKI